MIWVVEQRFPWGDYGWMLVKGFANRESEGGPLLLHRAGPFLPPISFPVLNGVVVSDEFRRELEATGLPGLRFGPAVKARIINLPWHKWDRTAATPKRYPVGGEPGEYIMDKPHDARVAAQMPEAWELLPPLVPLRMERLEDPDGGYFDKFRAYPTESHYPALFLSRHEYGHLVVNDDTRKWFESRVGEWVRFCEVELATTGTE